MSFNPYVPTTPQLSLSQVDPYCVKNYTTQTAQTVSSNLSATAYPVILNNSSTQNEEIRTVFITGFPLDVQERELNNLLRFLPGYRASQMNWKNGQAQGFALFDSGTNARQSIESISQLVFDENHVLRCELARKNMYVKDDVMSSRIALSQVPSVYQGELKLPPVNGISAPANGAVLKTGMPASVGPQGYGQITNIHDNPPCNTLFIGNLADTVDEQELKFLFSSQQGFRQMKLVRSERGTNCFVEYTDEHLATLVHHQQQGAILRSSDRGPIRIQYSKNPFNQKRDNFNDSVGNSTSVGGPYLSPSPRAETISLPSPHHQYCNQSFEN
eukprot:TRINITY_DN5378_c1_g2_i1.p2 TRINITY_DN5378_c1_g2~~TRINITY_DN5378_c1_g2_i1.p2  ORF type:complete len:329 (-),score=4.92 TRINITY_DN5378_c1_g2_i1:2416-3402(-)